MTQTTSEAFDIVAGVARSLFIDGDIRSYSISSSQRRDERGAIMPLHHRVVAMRLRNGRKVTARVTETGSILYVDATDLGGDGLVDMTGRVYITDDIRVLKADVLRIAKGPILPLCG